ncbi:carboxymuconolactone decarboxylase family protein [Mucilaginibacter sp. CAU 1740]|uniref:carboxymuconolactone decarboxylase family protein n=1 Tax=Mucilaginibacter sp. CAU 1740 TaxID=3140365 RepID=UPI00325B959D
MNELTQKGLKIFAELRGQERSNEVSEEIKKAGFSANFLTLSTHFVFGSVWARKKLAYKERSLVTMGILIALRATKEFGNHVKIGINNGLTIEEIEEIIIHSAVYAGFPTAKAASDEAISMLKELGFDV